MVVQEDSQLFSLFPCSLTGRDQYHNIWKVTQTHSVHFKAIFKVRLVKGFERDFLKVNVLS